MLKTSKIWVDNVINIIILSIFLLNKRQYIQQWGYMITLNCNNNNNNNNVNLI